MALYVQNNYFKTIVTAIIYYDPGCGSDPWFKQGWFRVTPGANVVVFSGAVNFARYWYIYAETLDREVIHSGDFPRMVTGDATSPFGQCVGNNTGMARTVNFDQFDVDGYINYTMQFYPR